MPIATRKKAMRAGLVASEPVRTSGGRTTGGGGGITGGVPTGVSVTVALAMAVTEVLSLSTQMTVTVSVWLWHARPLKSPSKAQV